MKTETLSNLLEFANDIAWRAGRLTLAHFQTGVQAERKEDSSPVTIADRAAEQFLRERITERFPHDGILGEEFGAVRDDAPRRWILDPIDGTRAFVRGVPLYGVMIALEVDREACLGVVHLPALGETVAAATGIGCWWDGRRARVSDTAVIEHALILTSEVERLTREPRAPGWSELVARASTARTWGDCYGYTLVATGRAEAMVDAVLSIWDAAAVFPLIIEAGGVITDLDGAPSYRSGSLVATNAVLATPVRELLGSTP